MVSPVDIAYKGQEVAIKIESVSGDAPKLYGRHFDHTDLLVSKVSRKFLIVNNYFILFISLSRSVGNLIVNLTMEDVPKDEEPWYCPTCINKAD